MSDNVKTGSDKPHDYASSPIDEYERACQQIMDDAALDLSDVQVNEVIQFAFELLRERTELLENALKTCRKPPNSIRRPKHLNRGSNDFLQNVTIVFVV